MVRFGLAACLLIASVVGCSARSPQFDQICSLPFGTALAYEGEGSLADLGLSQSEQRGYIIVTADRVPLPWQEAPAPPGGPSEARVACVDYGPSGGAEGVEVADDWEPPE